MTQEKRTSVIIVNLTEPPSEQQNTPPLQPYPTNTHQLSATSAIHPAPLCSKGIEATQQGWLSGVQEYTQEGLFEGFALVTVPS